jgi:hypothetical protein
VTKVNSTNVVDEGLRIRGKRASDELEGKDQSNKACIENKHGTEFGSISICPGRPLPAPIYRRPGLKEPVGFNTNYNIHIDEDSLARSFTMHLLIQWI